jgi:autotransporter-associated beta strand protein
MKPTTRLNSLSLHRSIVAAALSTIAPLAQATTFTWTNAAGGSWATAGNWSGGGTLPTTTSDTADFSTLNITANSTVSLNGNQSINKMLFSDTALSPTAYNTWTVAAGAPSSSTLTLGGTNASIDVATSRTAIITAQMAGSDNWTKTGGGTLRLTKTANNFSGDITVQTGILEEQRGALGTTAGKTYINSTGSTTTGGQLYMNANGVLYSTSEQVVIQGTGNVANGTGTAALRLGGSAGSATTFSEMNGLITLDGNANYKIEVYLQPSHWKINGGITRSGTNTGTLFLNLTHLQLPTPMRLTINSAIDNNGGAVTLLGDSAGILQMDVAGHDIGDFTINGAYTETYQTILKLGINDALATNKNLTITKGTFDLGGYNQTVNGLSGVASVSLITNTGSADSKLTVGNGGGGATFSGVIQDGTTHKLSLEKTGIGTQTLAGANTYTGATTIKAGTLTLGAGGSLASTNIVVGDTGSSNAGLNVSAVTGGFKVASGQKLSGIGTVTGATTIQDGGTLAPGNSSGTVTFSAGLTFASGSIFEWDIEQASTADPGAAPAPGGTNAGSYDQVVMNGSSGSLTGSGGIFKVVLGAGKSFTDTFWDTNKTWNNIFTGSGVATADLAAIFPPSMPMVPI